MSRLEELTLDRDHVAHLLDECEGGRHPATLEDEASLQRDLERLDAEIARLTGRA